MKLVQPIFEDSAEDTTITTSFFRLPYIKKLKKRKSRIYSTYCIDLDSFLVSAKKELRNFKLRLYLKERMMVIGKSFQV